MPPVQTFDLWPQSSAHNVPVQGHPRPCLELYLPEGGVDASRSRPAVVVCPGGGYGGLAAHEGAPFAELFARNGLVGLVVYYRCAPNRFPAPYADVCRAIRLTRAHAAEWGVDPQRIALMGFSAGGHLAATVGTQPDLHRDPEDDLACVHGGRPDRLILAYPVISMSEEHHEGSAQNLLGPDLTPAQRLQFSNDLQVTAGNPPTFLFHTAEDQAVPVSNSLRYAAACARLKIPFALHVYPHGPHGVGLAVDRPSLRNWSNVLLEWLKDW